MKYDFVAKLQGNSGSRVSIVRDQSRLCVLKQGKGPFSDHATVFDTLRLIGLKTPRVYSTSDVHMLMDYIPGQTIQTYLDSNSGRDLLEYFIRCFELFDQHSQQSDFTQDIRDKFRELEHSLPPNIILPFSLEELESHVPKVMPRGVCHGDLSLENILYHERDFYLIDCSHKQLNSWWLDAAKLSQDLDAHWFIRNQNPSQELLDRLNTISKQLRETVAPADDKALNCFMLLRVLPYCQTDWDKMFIVNKLEMLWT